VNAKWLRLRAQSGGNPRGLLEWLGDNLIETQVEGVAKRCRENSERNACISFRRLFWHFNFLRGNVVEQTKDASKVLDKLSWRRPCTLSEKRRPVGVENELKLLLLCRARPRLIVFFFGHDEKLRWLRVCQQLSLETFRGRQSVRSTSLPEESTCLAT
jgi:hypothetical protein